MPQLPQEACHLYRSRIGGLVEESQQGGVPVPTTQGGGSGVLTVETATGFMVEAIVKTTHNGSLPPL